MSTLQHLSLIITITIINAAVPPPWTWDTVQTFFQGCNSTGATFNDTILSYIIRNPIVVIEKCQGDNMTTSNPGYYEDNALAAAKQIKAINKSIHMGFYINSQLDFIEYSMHNYFSNHSEWWLRNATGAVIRSNGGANTKDPYNHLNFDFSQDDEAKWWSSACTNATDTPYFDLCNIDRVYTWGQSYKNNETLSNQTLATFDPYKFTSMQNMQRHLNDTDKGVICINNGFPIPDVNGYCLEGWQPIEDDILMLCNRSNLVDLFVIKVHSGYHLADGCAGQSFINALAGYLIGAQKYQYFQCNVAWSMPVNAGWQREYEYPLGEPDRQPVKINNTWFRSFKSGTNVMFHANNNTGEIFWSNEYDAKFLQDMKDYFYVTLESWHKDWRHASYRKVPLMVIDRKPTTFFKKPRFLPFPPQSSEINRYSAVFGYPLNRYHYAIKHGGLKQFAGWSRDLAEWVRFLQSTVLCDSTYINTSPIDRLEELPEEKISCGNAICIGTEEMEAAGISTSQFAITAQNCVSDYFNEYEKPCTEPSSALWSRVNTTIGNERVEWVQEGNMFDEIVARDTTQNWAIIKLKRAKRYMKIQELKEGENVESLMQCAVNPERYVPNDNIMGDQDERHGMGRFDEALLESFYGRFTDPIFLGLNQKELHIFSEYKQYLEERGIEFLWDERTSLVLPNNVAGDSNGKIYKTLLPGLGEHSGSGVSVKPGYIFGIFATDFNGTYDEQNVSTIVPLPFEHLRQIINSHYLS